MRQLFTILLLFLFLQGYSQYPNDVESVLKMSGKNRGELEKAIHYFQKDPDTLKLKAVYFLIANMDIHYSVNYYWGDSLNRPVPFNELSYPTFEASLKAFEEIKKQTPGIHPVPITYRDIDSIKGDFLIENVKLAFEAWKKPWAKNLPFEDFCEYILPYRVSVEPLQDWREIYNKNFDYVNDSIRGKKFNQVSSFLKRDLQKWFINTYGIENRKEPLPRLGSLQLLHRKKAPCEDIADLQVFLLRSLGIPSTIDFVPFWATASGKHWMNVIFDSQGKPNSFDAASTSQDNGLVREPAKVLRVTYSSKGGLTDYVQVNEIPEGFLKKNNYEDVTSEYWQVQEVRCKLFSNLKNQKVAYACVFNYSEWRPAWWGIIKNDTVSFSNMCQGAIYLPTYFKNGKMFPAGYPVLSNKDSQLELKPDTIHKRNIKVYEHEKYLVYRQGKIYSLYYWNNKWILAGTKKAGMNAKFLSFDEVPDHVLLLLKPEYSKNKERPFITTEDGNQLWW